MFGVTSKRNLMTQNDLKNMRHQSVDNRALKIFTGTCTEIRNDTELPSKDASVSDDFEPIFSQMLLSGHKTSKPDRIIFGKNFKPTDLGYSPVRIMSSGVRWSTTENEITTPENSDNFHTEIEYLSEMCETGELTPMDVMGIALVADNELVKYERNFDDENARNVFDCELNNIDKLYTDVKSMLTTVGFTYTEVIPFNLLPLPDHDSPSMTLTRRYGGRVPTSPTINPQDEKLSVRVTRWITKKHVHVFPMVNASTKVPQRPPLSSAGTDYDEECSKATIKVIQKYIADLDVPETTERATETDIPLVSHISTQCCPTDFDDPTLGSYVPTTTQL